MPIYGMPGDKYVPNEYGGMTPERVMNRNNAFNRMDDLALKERNGTLTDAEKAELAALRKMYPDMSTRWDKPENIWTQ